MAYSFTQLAQLLMDAGANATQAAIGAAIGLAESGGDPNAVGDQGTSFGIWQIHLPAHPNVSQSCATDPGCSANAVQAISSNFTNWSPWSTYNSGAYQQFLQTVNPPGQPVSSPDAGNPVSNAIGNLGGDVGNFLLYGGETVAGGALLLGTVSILVLVVFQKSGAAGLVKTAVPIVGKLIK